MKDILDVSLAKVGAEQNITQQSNNCDKMMECQALSIGSSILTVEDNLHEHVKRSKHAIDQDMKYIIVEEIPYKQIENHANTIDSQDKHVGIPENFIDSGNVS